MWVVHENYEHALYLKWSDVVDHLIARKRALQAEAVNERYVFHDHGGYCEVVKIGVGPVIIGHRHV